MLWDALFLLLRPHSLPGGRLHYLWQPYALYLWVDQRYTDVGDTFGYAQAWLSLAEVVLNIATFLLVSAGLLLIPLSTTQGRSLLLAQVHTISLSHDPLLNSLMLLVGPSPTALETKQCCSTTGPVRLHGNPVEGSTAHDPALLAVRGGPHGSPPALGTLPPPLHPPQRSLAGLPQLPGLGLQPHAHGHTQSTHRLILYASQHTNSPCHTLLRFNTVGHQPAHMSYPTEVQHSWSLRQ